MIILGNDNDYLTVYTYLTNAEALELLKRSIEVLEYEDKLDSEVVDSCIKTWYNICCNSNRRNKWI